MKEILKQLPSRTIKARENGLTMIMDKGLSLNEAEEFLSTSIDYTDIVKLGFGTSIITPNITEKIKLYQRNRMHVYAGGTLFEAFLIRDQLDDYKRYIDNIGLEMVEVSDGCINIEHDLKCEIIADLSKNYKVISEVGSKDSSVEFKNKDWIKWIGDELTAGSWKVITEAREGGNVGIFDSNGGIKAELIEDIITAIPLQNIIWESPTKDQQVWFINKFGPNTNLGNIAPNHVISLECLRLGLRADTFNNFLKK